MPTRQQSKLKFATPHPTRLFCGGNRCMGGAASTALKQRLDVAKVTDKPPKTCLGSGAAQQRRVGSSLGRSGRVCGFVSRACRRGVPVWWPWVRCGGRSRWWGLDGGAQTLGRLHPVAEAAAVGGWRSRWLGAEAHWRGAAMVEAAASGKFMGRAAWHRCFSHRRARRGPQEYQHDWP